MYDYSITNGFHYVEDSSIPARKDMAKETFVWVDARIDTNDLPNSMEMIVQGDSQMTSTWYNTKYESTNFTGVLEERGNTWNTNCWCYDADLTCVEIWNNMSYTHSANIRAATLITPQVFITATHFPVKPTTSVVTNDYDYLPDTTNCYVVFLDRDNIPHAGRVVQTNTFWDFCYGKLAEPMTNAITPAKLLPPDAADYIKDGAWDGAWSMTQLLGIFVDQVRYAQIKMLTNVDQILNGLRDSGIASWDRYGAKNFIDNTYDCDVADKDSGSPCFVIIGGDAVFLYPNNRRNAERDAAISQLSPFYTYSAACDIITNNFGLTELPELVDLSGYKKVEQ